MAPDEAELLAHVPVERREAEAEAALLTFVLAGTCVPPFGPVLQPVDGDRDGLAPCYRAGS